MSSDRMDGFSFLSLAETTLRALKKSQREKVEELKKKTGYYSTRNLLEKYDEAIKKNVRLPFFFQISLD